MPRLLPPFLLRLFSRLAQDLVSMSWPMAIAIVVVHGLSVALGYRLLGETDLVSGIVQFIYFYIVTGSSVGYGDFSPSSEAGKLFSALWVIPGALALFGFLIGKVIASISNRIRKTMNGYGDFSQKTGHLVVIGYDRNKLARLMEETARLHGQRDILIVTREDLSGQQDGWDFVRASALSNRDDLKRAGITGADHIVVLAANDEETMAACLAVSALAASAHAVAYLRDHATADLVATHCPQFEVITSTSVEQVARALSDPGAGNMLNSLVNADIEGTLHSIEMAGAPSISVLDLMGRMMTNHRATLMGFRPEPGAAPILSLEPDMQIKNGQTVYYVAAKRIAPDVAIAA